MLGASDIGGMMAMMPAFATDQAADLRATDTVSVERLRAGADRMVRDGANMIATTGSFGECHALLSKEFETLARETVDVVRRREPLDLFGLTINQLAKLNLGTDEAPRIFGEKNATKAIHAIERASAGVR
jgi:dihydrodipicolinate synthase/N-acetylneuraminate lyase